MKKEERQAILELISSLKHLDAVIEKAIIAVRNAKTHNITKEASQTLSDGLHIISEVRNNLSASLQTMLSPNAKGTLTQLSAQLKRHSNALTIVLDKLPENQAFYQKIGKSSYADLSNDEKTEMVNHLITRLGEAITEGFLRDHGLSSKEELNDKLREELKKKIATELAKWR